MGDFLQRRRARLMGLCLAALVGRVGADEVTPRPRPFAVREFYAPGHFGNTHEVMGEREMRDVIADAKAWGYTSYGDWFDVIDCSDPFVRTSHDMARALWDRKKRHFRSATALGLDCTLMITPNHVYVDQVSPPLAAQGGDRIMGQLICPSRPEARRIILANHERLFVDLARAGVRLRGLTAAPYDYGGCGCPACRPWIVTFASLCREIHAVAERHHPGVEMRFLGWWWNREEHRLFAEWVDREALGWAKAVALHMPYGAVDVGDVVVPARCERWAFVHIGYGEEAEPRDVYGHLGPVIAAARLERTVQRLEAQGVTGLMAYSEGSFDDVNRAILGSLASGLHGTADEALRAYARRYFDAQPPRDSAWAAWLRDWGRPFARDPAAAAAGLASLTGSAHAAPWRLDQWRSKTRLMALHAAVGDGTEWPAARLATADEFWAERERLDRELYGLGPTRHIFHPDRTPVTWFSGWARHTGRDPAEPALRQAEQ